MSPDHSTDQIARCTIDNFDAIVGIADIDRAAGVGADQVALNDIPGLPAPLMYTPSELPEITLPAPTAVPPIVLLLAPLKILTPLNPFAIATLPVASTPM